MATKEEHLWRMLESKMALESDLRLSLAEALAERDAAREELAKLKAAQPSAEVKVRSGDPCHVALWDAINAYGAAGGGGPSISGARMDAVAAVEKALRDYLKAAQPEPAPVAGGVTEAMLGEIVKKRLVPKEFVDAVARARAAIRAQKRVDVEMLRKLAASFAEDGLIARASLMRRAIGDEPAAEAPAQPSPPLVSVLRVSLAEPATPQETAQGGPFTDNGGFGWITDNVGSGWINDNGVAALKAITEEAAKRYTRLLNSGLEAEKLRARLAQVEARERSNVAELEASRDHEKARADDAEAKLAALGENSIPRALVERYREKWSRFGAGDILADLLAGREPGAQQA